jgi:hypothetical protein
LFKIYDGREAFYQWDLDRKLVVEDETIAQVHFCNCISSNALVCETYKEDGLTLVNVPNILLQDNWRIHIFAYDVNYTKHSTEYEVIARSKPSGYVYTETEIKDYADLEERLAALEENTVPEELVREVVEDYLEENPVEAGADTFIAVYDETALEEITEAYSDGKVVYCNYENMVLFLTEISSAGASFVCHTDNDTTFRVFCENRKGMSLWRFTETDMATQEQVDTTIPLVVQEELKKIKDSGDFAGSSTLVFEGANYNISGNTVSFDATGLKAKYGRDVKVNDLVLFGTKLFIVTTAAGGGAAGSFVLDMGGAAPDLSSYATKEYVNEALGVIENGSY